jgi:hypothetical protein
MLSQYLTSLDPASRLTIKRMAVTLALSALLAFFAKTGQHLNFFIGLTGLAVLVSSVLALRARQHFNASSLNFWDETVFYIAVSALALAVAGG